MTTFAICGSFSLVTESTKAPYEVKYVAKSIVIHDINEKGMCRECFVVIDSNCTGIINQQEKLERMEEVN
ncbi:hypothetical protein A7K91_12660 [Paenibacillus oryzae]|uniref:Uncharacterized protein n=1 Tax=Paenibacillus oryzae TaxID=1844972 RepID=A0A1A5YFJ1_9BACL|nr:hypothetical protein [Paenibacillus oryzae]OBR64353.1 hypothetical protein A7K91_12660 [Paenibacillus oryzae]